MRLVLFKKKAKTLRLGIMGTVLDKTKVTGGSTVLVLLQPEDGRGPEYLGLMYYDNIVRLFRGENPSSVIIEVADLMR